MMTTEWRPGTGSALLRRETVPADLSALVPTPRRESDHPAVPDRAVSDGAGPDRDEPLDVRLHAPRPDTVIVRVAGPLHPRSCPMLAIRVRQQLHRAPHVILDLSSVTWLDLQVAGELRALHRKAVECGTHLHIAAENEPVVEGLRRIDVGERVVLGTADAVLACLAARNG
jgi:anti-anti-sigma regulatory factor